MQPDTHKTDHAGYLRLWQIVGNPNIDHPPLIPVSRSTIWSWVSAGKFPQPIKLSSAVTVWRASEVYDFVERGGVEQ